MESGASDHAGGNRKQVEECVLAWYLVLYCINVLVKRLLCTIKCL